MKDTTCIASLVVGALLLISGCKGDDCPGTGMSPYDYSQALCMSYLFYEAQRSGPLPSSQRVKWRGNSAMQDGSDHGHDLAGGYYDAGDFVKFGFPMAFSATMLAWGLIDFANGYSTAGQTSYGQEGLKWATDYFLKAHTGHYELYGQVGDGDADHGSWGRPEEMTEQRPSFKIDSSNPGSDLAGETAAALAAASIVFKQSDSSYASKCLDAAKELFSFADENRQTYDTSIPQAANFYKSWSGYEDELCWSALWLNRATSDSSYLDKAKGYWDSFKLGSRGPKQFSWDDKTPGVYALYAALSSDSTYKNTFTSYLKNITTEGPYTPGGLIFLDQWGSNRHAANVAFLALYANKIGVDASANQEFGKKQIDYILGSNGRSFVVGFGNNPPQRPHHRASSCPNEPATCDWNAYNSPDPNPQVLYGAVVGGPDQNDGYTDARSDFQHNEVACDYNAAFTGALAALVEHH